MASQIYTLYYGIQYFPQVASWGFSYLIYPFFNITYNRLFKQEEPRNLSPMEAEMFDKLKRGELRMYEVAAPSVYDEKGIHTRFIILERPTTTCEFTERDIDGPVFL